MMFLLYINGLPHFVNNKSTPILFADDTSILFTHSDTTEFNSSYNLRNYKPMVEKQLSLIEF